MPDLAEDIRASAPQPDEAFVARLERRVEAGFAKPAKRRRPKRDSLLRPVLVLAATVLVAGVVALGALRGSGGEDDSASSGSSGGGTAVSSAPSDESSRGGLSEDLAPTTRSAAPSRRLQSASGPLPRVVERSTALELAPPDDAFDDVTDGVLRVADESGAIVQRSNVTQRGDRGHANFDLRVPASRLDEALANLSRLTHVRSRTAASDDITAGYTSARDRLQDARDERDALLQALAKAATDAEAAALKQRIADARLSISAAKADVQRIRARGQRARVTVTVDSTGKRSEGGAWTPGDAMRDAARVLEVAAGVLVVGAAFLAPFALLALLAALAAGVLRRRRREGALG